MVSVLTIIRLIDLAGFITANIFVTLFFIKFFTFISLPYIFLLFILALFVSLIVIKTELWFWIFEISHKGSSTNLQFQSYIRNRSFWSFIAKIGFPVSLKLFFLNTLYYLFPVLLVWVVLIAILYLLGWVELPHNSYFFQILTSFGILLGIFQYFVKRHEEKITSRISQISMRINKIIAEETSFEKFFRQLDKYPEYKELKGYINSIIDPKVYAKEIISSLLSNKEISRNLLRFLKKRSGPIFNISVTNLESEKMFEIVENSIILNRRLQKMLINAYKNFFLDEHREKKIVKRIENEIDINEFTKLVSSNINIIHEVLPEFLNLKFREVFENLFVAESKADKILLRDIPSYRDFREYLSANIIKQILGDILIFVS